MNDSKKLGFFNCGWKERRAEKKNVGRKKLPLDLLIVGYINILRVYWTRMMNVNVNVWI
jgi:hypothetical protein